MEHMILVKFFHLEFMKYNKEIHLNQFPKNFP